MAILSHCELLVEWGGSVDTGRHRYEASGACQFETLIPKTSKPTKKG